MARNRRFLNAQSYSPAILLVRGGWRLTVLGCSCSQWLVCVLCSFPSCCCRSRPSNRRVPSAPPGLRAGRSRESRAEQSSTEGEGGRRGTATQAGRQRRGTAQRQGMREVTNWRADDPSSNWRVELRAGSPGCPSRCLPVRGWPGSVASSCNHVPDHASAWLHLTHTDSTLLAFRPHECPRRCRRRRACP
jgi:hypothetical protein